MAIGVKIDFEGTYELDSVSEDFTLAAFKTPLVTGNSVLLTIKISPEPHAILPDVYNLAYGLMDDRGQLDDQVQLPHKNYSKVFSTILLHSFNYLKHHPDHFLGIDGSDNLRAYYYWRFLQRNFDYLSQHFEMFGVKYYVRITRYGKTQYENPFDFDDISQDFEKITKTKMWPVHMFNYYTFRLKSD